MKFTLVSIFILTVCFLSNTGPLFAQPPSIVSFTPSSGDMGYSVTITGSNFGATPSNNTVYFGSACVPSGGITSAGSTSLTVTVPTGAFYAPITVTNLSTHLTGASSKPFTATFHSTHVVDATSFAPRVNIGAVSLTDPRRVLTGDMNNDGKLDLIIADGTGPNGIAIFRNTSTPGSLTAGSFAAPVYLSMPSGEYKLSLGDLDGDGLLDLAAGCFGAHIVSLFRNTSAGDSISFGTRADLAMDGETYSTALADIDGDGKNDIVVSNYNTGTSSHTVSVFRNTGSVGSLTTSSFAARVDVTTGASATTEMRAGDINGDGRPDIVFTDESIGEVFVQRNTSSSGAVSFAAQLGFVLTFPGAHYGLALGDVDGDGKLDIAVANKGGHVVSILRDTGSVATIGFLPRVDFNIPGGGEPYECRFSDMNGDGKTDLVVAIDNGSRVMVFRNDASPGVINTGSMTSGADFITDGNPFGIDAGDLDGDGKPDMVTANIGSHNLSMFRNKIPTTVDVSLALVDKWNLVSLPVNALDPSVASLFPGSTTAFSYIGGSYTPSSTMSPGYGYWLRYPSSTSVAVSGLVLSADTIAVVEGWNLLGSVSQPVPTSSIVSQPPGITAGHFFGYSGSYIATDTIRPGGGYWVKVNQDGVLILSPTVASTVANAIRIVPTSELPPYPPPGTINSIPIPSEFALEQNYPNPFNPTTVIRYQMPVAGTAKLSVYNLLGQEVSILVDGVQEAGFKSVEWNAGNAASGMYYYKLVAIGTDGKQFTEVKRMILLK